MNAAYQRNDQKQTAISSPQLGKRGISFNNRGRATRPNANVMRDIIARSRRRCLRNGDKQARNACVMSSWQREPACNRRAAKKTSRSSSLS